MATAGRIPTTTVCASRTRAMLAMFASIRPMNESTRSSDEMSISTPRAPTAAMRVVRSSWSVRASRSSMSTWMLTIRNSPILRMGMRSIGGALPPARLQHGAQLAGALEREQEGVGERGLGRHALQVDAEVHDRLGDLRSDAADDALGAH